MRLPNGYGAVVKLPGKRRRPYAARITVEYDENGRQKYKYLGYFRLRSEALACLKEYNDNPYNIKLTDITFQELYERWKEWKLSSGASIKTVYNAAYLSFQPLTKSLFVDLKANDYQRIIDKLKLGYNTKITMKTLINQMYKYAQMLDVPVKNYGKFIVVHRDAMSTLHKPFTDDELKTLWKYKKNKDIQIVLIYIYTGLRPSELLSIKTENVFLDEKYMIGGIKTLAGKNRIIPIADKILPFITSLFNKENKYLLVDETGEKMTYYKFRETIWNNVLVKDHLPHDCRHTCATLLSNANVDRKIIQLILGHSTGDVTDGVYIHKTTEQLIRAINSI